MVNSFYLNLLNVNDKMLDNAYDQRGVEMGKIILKEKLRGK